MKKKRNSLSFSKINSYLKCPRQYYFTYVESIPAKTDYARLCGTEVHAFVHGLYRPTADERPFYYKSIKSAINAWIGRWQRALDKAYRDSQILFASASLEEEYKKVGMYCVINYWKGNVNLARPLEIEKRYSSVTRNGIRLAGIIDQVREMPVEWIECHRPEIVSNGKLTDEFVPVVLVDLKTSRYSYDLLRLNSKAELLEESAFQFSLHEDLQATVYTYLYEKIHGKKPVGFQWYHLRSGKSYFTYRTESDYKTLDEVVSHLTDNFSLQSYPKCVTSACRYCDYFQHCRENRPLLVSSPEAINGCDSIPRYEPNLITKIPNTQPKLTGLKIARARKRKQKSEGKSMELFQIGPFPWEEDKIIVKK